MTWLAATGWLLLAWVMLSLALGAGLAAFMLFARERSAQLRESATYTIRRRRRGAFERVGAWRGRI